MSLLLPSGMTCASSNASRHTSMKMWVLLLWLKNGSLQTKLSTTMLVSACWNCAKGEERGKTLWTKKLAMTLPIKLPLLTLCLKQGSLLLLSQGFVQGSSYLHPGTETPLLMSLLSLLLPFPNPSNRLLLSLKAPTPFLPLRLEAHLAFVNPLQIPLEMSNHGKAKPTLRHPLFWPPLLTKSAG